MKPVKILTTINLVHSIFAIALFLFNQLCNLRFLGLWVAWNLSGYAFGLLVGPAAIIFSIVCTIISLVWQGGSASLTKYRVINIACTAVVLFLEVGLFTIYELMLWA